LTLSKKLQLTLSKKAVDVIKKKQLTLSKKLQLTLSKKAVDVIKKSS